MLKILLIKDYLQSSWNDFAIKNFLLVIFYLLMPTKRISSIFYRITTILFSLYLLTFMFWLINEFKQQEIVNISSSIWFSHLIGIILFPPHNLGRLKERAYSALGIFYLSAFYGYYLWVGEPIFATVMPLIIFWVLLISYLIQYYSMDKKKK
jgi:hypothetical protein